MRDSADPLDGWNLRDVKKVIYGPASNDLYGKLYLNLAELLSAFHDRLRRGIYNFILLNLDAKDLPSRCRGTKFARIEVGDPFRYTTWRFANKP